MAVAKLPELTDILRQLHQLGKDAEIGTVSAVGYADRKAGTPPFVYAGKVTAQNQQPPTNILLIISQQPDCAYHKIKSFNATWFRV
jgi:hypothetical protein